MGDSEAEMELAEPVAATCINCGASLNENDRFCRKCGARQEMDIEPDVVTRKWNNVRQLLLFFVIEALICAGSRVKVFHAFGSVFGFDAMAAILAIVFTSLNWRMCRPLLKWNNFSVSRLA